MEGTSKAATGPNVPSVEHSAVVNSPRVARFWRPDRNGLHSDCNELHFESNGLHSDGNEQHFESNELHPEPQ